MFHLVTPKVPLTVYELGSTTCILTSFFWVLNQVIYLKVTRALHIIVSPFLVFQNFNFFNDEIYSYTKKNYLALGI